MRDKKYWQEKLQLEAHPEGGYYKEVYRNPNTIQIMNGGGTRNLATSIYFMLGAGDKSHFHQLTSDELWYYHEGATVDVHIFEHGQYRLEKLGCNPEDGESLQILLPRQSIFAAEISQGQTSDFALMGCVVNPGFDFKDFRMIGKEELMKEYATYEDLIDQFTLKDL